MENWIKKLTNIANVTENTWIPEDEDGNDYDARAYRANSEGSV